MVPKAASPLLLALAVLGAYGQTVLFPLTWDDPALSAHAREAWEKGGVPGLLAADYGYPGLPPVGYWRPVATASLWLDGALSGSPVAFHATSVLLYLLAVLAFFLLAREVLPPSPSGAPLAAALLFALWPAHAESVAMAGNRHDLLAALFSFLSALAWARDGERPRPWLPAAGGLALLAAALSKESAMVLPAALVAWGWIDRRGPRPRWLAAWGSALAAAFLARLAFFPGGFGEAGGAVPASLGDPPLLFSRLAGLASMLAWPWPPRLWYGRPEAMISWGTAAGAVLLLALSAAAGGGQTGLWGWKGAAWAGAFILPVLGIVPIGGAVLAGRHIFAASAGTCLMLGALGARLPLRTAAVGLALAVAALGAGSFWQARAFRSELALASRLVRDAPGEDLPRANLAGALLGEGRDAEALEQARLAIAFGPGWEAGYLDAGVALARMGSPRGAEAAFRAGRAAAPGSADLRHNLALLLEREGRGEEARAERAAERALREPGD